MRRKVPLAVGFVLLVASIAFAQDLNSYFESGNLFLYFELCTW